MTPLLERSGLRIVQKPAVFGRCAGCQATSVATPIQVVILLVDKNRFPVHNVNAVGPAP